jgi:hypothetical protein
MKILNLKVMPQIKIVTRPKLHQIPTVRFWYELIKQTKIDKKSKFS